jgi:predicted dehydrogenase
MMAADFDGKTYDHDRDHERLRAQLDDVRMFMWDGDWHTLDQIAGATGHPPASVSARLRDLRKSKFGAFLVDREYVSRGLFRYRVRVAGKLPF